MKPNFSFIFAAVLLFLVTSFGFATPNLIVDTQSTGDAGIYNDHYWSQGVNFSSDFNLYIITVNLSNTGAGISARVGLWNSTGWIESVSMNITGNWQLYNFTFSGSKVILANTIPNSYNVTINFTRSSPADTRIGGWTSSPAYLGGYVKSESTVYASNDFQIQVWNMSVSDFAPPAFAAIAPTNNGWLNPNRDTLNVTATDDAALANVSINGNWTNQFRQCYQETANISTSCGGLATGTYELYKTGDANVHLNDASDTGIAYLRDGNWNTCATPMCSGGGCGTANIGIQVNYTKVSSNQTEQYGFGGTGPPEIIQNTTIPTDCQLATVSIRYYFVNDGFNSIKLDCFNGTVYRNIGGGISSSTAFCEEGTWWNTQYLASTQTNSTPQNNTVTRFNVTGLSDATYYSWNATACDTSGKCNMTANYFFTTDLLYPQISNVQPINLSNVYQNATTIFNATITDANLNTSWLEFKGANWTLSNLGGDIWGVSFTSIPDGKYIYRFWANDSAGNTNMSDTYNITVFNPYLGICGGAYSSIALNISFYDEDTLINTSNTYVEWNGSIQVNNILTATNGSMTNGTLLLCIYPSGTDFNTSLILKYNSPSHVTRYYYIENQLYSNTTTNLSIYQLQSGTEHNLTIYATDAGGNPLSGALINFYRWYPSTNIYRLVAIGKTGTATPPDGIAYVKIKNGQDTYFKVVLIENGQITNSIEPKYFKDTDTSYTIQSILSGLDDYWTYAGKIFSNCTATGNRTSLGIIGCTVTDVSSSAITTYFNVLQTNDLGLPNTTICSSSSTEKSKSYGCSVGNITGHSYYYYLTMDKGKEIGKSLESGILSGMGAYDSDNAQKGLIAAFILTLGLGCVFASKGISAFIVGLVLGLWLSQFLNLINFGYIALMLISITAYFIIRKVKV